MFIQDVFLKYYDFRPTGNTFINKIIGNLSKITGIMANFFLPYWFAHNSMCNYYLKSKKAQVVVSMTSFPARINNVWLVVECLLRQTVVPAHIVLYLSKEQFSNESSLPQNLRRYSPRVLKIRFVEGDIRSHKKYWYALHDYPQIPIITVDDDIIYDSHLVSDLLSAANNAPLTIPCCFGGHMSWTEGGEIKAYTEWSGGCLSYRKRDKGLFFGSGGGTLFPVGSLDGARETWDVIKEICPTADDIWLNAITRINGYYPMKVRKRKGVPEWNIENNIKLSTINNGNKANDIQLLSVQKWCLMSYGMNPFQKCHNIDC